MSLVFFDGFASYPAMRKPEWSTGGLAATGRTGVASEAMAMNGAAICFLATPATGITLGVAMTVADARQLTGSTFQVLSSGNVAQLGLNQDSMGRPTLRLGGTTGTIIATGSSMLSGWNYWELQVSKLTTGTDGRVIVKVNGNVEIDFTGKTANATTPITAVQFTSNGAGWLVIDDLYICDNVDATATQGRANNTFLGECSVVTAAPNADGASSGFTPTPAGSHWSTVDENPVNTTDYVAASASGTRDLYEVQDLAAAAKTVFGVRVGLYASASDAGAVSIKATMRDATGAVRTGPARGLTTAWLPIHDDMLATNPLKAAGTPFTPADVNGLQVGMDVG